MKVLHIFDHSIPLHSGYTFRSRAILKEQHKLGITTCHVTSSKQGETQASIEKVDGLQFYRSEVPKGLSAKLPLLNQASVVRSLKKRLRDVIKLEKPDILHAHSPALNGLAAIQVGKEFGIPVVYEIRAFWEDAAVDHGTCQEGDLRYRFTQKLENYVIKRANHVTTICDGLKNDLVKRGVNEAKITQIPNAVDFTTFADNDVPQSAQDKLREELGLEDKYVLGFLGSFYAYEGLDLLLDAMPELIKKDSTIHLLLVGGGPQEHNLKELVKHHKLEQHVTFTGRVPHQKIKEYYSLVNLLVFPRKSMRLTELVTPLKPLEAMAQHKLVLASDVGGHKELIEHNSTGYLFDANSLNSLCKTILSIRSKKSNEEITANGFEFVKNVRNWTNSVSNYQHIYKNLSK